jgi:hypothetical protein
VRSLYDYIEVWLVQFPSIVLTLVPPISKVRSNIK